MLNTPNPLSSSLSTVRAFNSPSFLFLFALNYVVRTYVRDGLGDSEFKVRLFVSPHVSVA